MRCAACQAPGCEPLWGSPRYRPHRSGRLLWVCDAVRCSRWAEEMEEHRAGAGSAGAGANVRAGLVKPDVETITAWDKVDAGGGIAGAGMGLRYADLLPGASSPSPHTAAATVLLNPPREGVVEPQVLAAASGLGLGLRPDRARWRSRAGDLPYISPISPLYLAGPRGGAACGECHLPLM